ncbi:VanZ family protein [Bacillus sp. OAE603]|uniref:VanZ family protein n=1 Tax=Gottfriedia sp. OAE603 TaxID=2663872 RepID=UPI00178A9AD1
MKLFMKIVLTLAFCLYLVILTNQILFKYVSPSEIISHFNFNNNDNRWHGHNFIPLKTIIYYLFLADINLNIRITNLVGNIIGFVPFGFILPILLKRFKNFKVIVIASFSLSLTYEVIQLLFDIGSFDIDDLILNTFGGLLGYIPIKLIQLINNSRKNHLKITTDL